MSESIGEKEGVDAIYALRFSERDEGNIEAPGNRSSENKSPGVDCRDGLRVQ